LFGKLLAIRPTGEDEYKMGFLQSSEKPDLKINLFEFS